MSQENETNLSFENACRKIVAEELRGNNPVPDLLGFLHLKNLFGPDITSTLNMIIDDHIKDSKGIQPLMKIDMPKANFTVRPMARPRTADWIIYEAIIDELAKNILTNSQICARSFSILYFKDKDEQKTSPWLKFIECAKKSFDTEHEYVVVADVTGYYENVWLEELRCRLYNYLKDPEKYESLLKVLFALLRKWSTERVPGYGIPQGPPGSAFLADIFLDHVDRPMEKYEGYFRYMDDIRIFCSSLIDAKHALKELILALRELKLNINAKKTKILEPNEASKILFDPQSALMNIIDAAIKSKDMSRIEPMIKPLKDLFFNAFSNDDFESTHLNFSLYRLAKLHASGVDLQAIEIIIIIELGLETMPHHTGLFCNFLSMFTDNKDIAKYLFDFLKSPENIYEWQEMKILQVLLRLNNFWQKEDIEFFLQSARNLNKHYAVRSFYILLVGKFGQNRDREMIVSLYDQLSESYSKMAVILSAQEMALPSRNSFYSRIKQNEKDDEIQRFLVYVHTLSNPIYYLDAKRPKIETYDEAKEPTYESF